MKNKNKQQHFITTATVGGGILISFLIANFFMVSFSSAQDVNDLNQKIQDRKTQVTDLSSKIKELDSKVKQTQKQSKTLANQLAILQNQIAKSALDIQSSQLSIEQTTYEIQELDLRITDLEKKIDSQKQKLAEYLRLVYQNDQTSYLEILLNNNTFSDFFDQLQTTQEIHSNLKTALNKFKSTKLDLETQKQSWQDKADQEQKLKVTLQEQQAALGEQTVAQTQLLSQSKLSEKKYQSNLSQLQLQQQQINSDIVTLEKKVREKLAAQQKANPNQPSLGSATLSWPVNPSRGISTYFHDPSYPFRYVYEHPGLDIRTPQGTPINAPADGYVARVQFRGDASYAYIMLIHSGGLSTVYGHVSAVSVKENQYVTKGQVIGLSGATPHSIGSGPLTTGPHLHFEVRLNGIPVNPLDYLP